VAAEPDRCDSCGLPERTDAEAVPPLEETEEQLAGWHQWARAFDYYQVHSGPGGAAIADAPPMKTALDFVHWVLAERRLRSGAHRREDRRAHHREGARQRWDRGHRSA